MMDTLKRRRLEEAGFQVGTVADFLGLTPPQSELLEIRLALTRAIRKQREARGLSPYQLAEKIGVTEAQFVKVEVGDPHASIDLLVKALVASGMTRRELAAVIAA
jgi:DNA-binding XRE family transcriptional regulator